MPLITWKNRVRIAIGELSRKAQLDLWRAYQNTGFDGQELKGELFLRYLAETDALVAMAATRSIQVLKDKKWHAVDAETIVQVDEGDCFGIAHPMTLELFNELPRSLADEWIKTATDLNGGINANLVFFTSLDVTSGKTNNAPESDKTPSSSPDLETTS